MTMRGVLPRPSDRGRYRFGDCLLDLDSGFLRRGGAEVPLRPKTFEVLRYLVLHHGTLVTKDELARAVWADVAVTDNSLAQCLLEIRRALQDDEQRIVRTVARRGYVFDAPVTVALADPHPPSEAVFPRGIVTSASLASTHDHLAAGAPAVHPGHTSPTAPSRRRPRWWGGALGLLAAVGVLSGAWALQRGDSGVVDDVPVQLTNFNDTAIASSLSHDGRVLAFIRGGTFGKVGAPGGQVYVKLVEGGEPVQLTHDSLDKTLPVFSPDDSTIVYTALLSGLRWDSWQVPVLGGKAQPFLPNASGLRWLRDGRLVYSTIKSGIHMGIATSSESRGDYREIYFPGHADGMAHRTFPSPDGKWLLVVEMLAGTWLPCRLVPFDGSSAGTPVSPSRSQCTSAAWSPDGRWMYFSSNAGGEFHLWRQRFPDGAPEQITFGPTEQEGTAITADGRHVITSMGLQQGSIWLHDATGERRLTDEGFVSRPALSVSGTRLFYLVRTRNSLEQMSGELWQADLETGQRQRILPGVVLASYSLSADDQSVVYSTSAGDPDEGIWIARIDRSTPPRRLVAGSGLRAFFGAAGEIIYEGEDGFLYRIHGDGATRERAAREQVSYLVSVSPDGRWAQAVMPRSTGSGTTSLWFVSLRGESSFEVCNEACSFGPRSFEITAPFAWSRDGGSLLVNLGHFGHGVGRGVVLPYRSGASPAAVWPAGLDTEAHVMANPGARVIDQRFTVPASDADNYLFASLSTHSNLYRVRLPD
jgi:DNA-binding winged helix-turn-helix (wHTH) protein/Tol biopolymer transport system component